MEKLAIDGGKKTLDDSTRHFEWPIITEETIQAVNSQLKETISIYNRSGIIERVEKQMEAYFNVKHALLVSSGTLALHTLFFASKLEPGDEVIVPAYTFFATVSPLFFEDIVPILVDCTLDGNINPDKIEEKITEKTKAIIVTHMWGRPCDMKKICAIAKKHNLLLFEDNSHAFGSSINGKKTGTFGDGAAMSLQGGKTITGGEGGLLITNDDEIYYKALLLGHYNKRCKQEIPNNHPLYKYALTGYGLKYRSHPLSCAIIEQQMSHLQDFLDGREKVANYIISEINQLKGLYVVPLPENEKSSWYSLIINYDQNLMNGVKIETFFKGLKAEGCIEADIPTSTCSLSLIPLFQDSTALFPNLSKKMSYKIGDFPIAEYMSKNCIKLPVWYQESEMRYAELYVKAFKKVYHHFIQS